MANLATRAQQILRQPGFAGLLGTAFALGLGFSFVSPFLSLWLTREIGLSPTRLGLYLTATTLCTLVVGTTLAHWSDTHVPRKTMLLAGGAGGVLGYAGYALLKQPALLLAAGCTLLALAGVCFSQLFAHVRARYFAAPEEGRAGAATAAGVSPAFLTSLVRVCFSIAWTTGPSIGAWLMVAQGYRGMFFGAAALYLVFLLGVWRFVPLAPHPPHLRTAVREPVWRVITRGDIFALFAGFALIFAAHTMNMLNLPLRITQDLGGTEVDVGIAFGVGPAAEIPLMLWFGLLAARGHQLALIRFGALATVGYFLLLTLARTPWHVFPLQILHGLSFAVISNVAIVFFQDLLPGQPGLATTIFSNAANVGNLVGFLSFSAFAPAVGHQGLFLVSAAFAAATCVVVIAYRPRRANP